MRNKKNKEIYVYPRLSSFDCYFFRIGGHGLGNLLFVWSRAFVLSKILKAKIIQPTWFQIILGTYLRNERDKRGYYNVFINPGNYVVGIPKILACLNFKTKKINTLNTEELNTITDETYINVEMSRTFSDISNYSDLIRSEFKKILHYKYLRIYNEQQKHYISFHIRRGDFLIGKQHTEIEYFYFVYNHLYEVNKMKFHIKIFTDQIDNEILEFSKFCNGEILNNKNAIIDLIIMSKSDIIIASKNSTFSQWSFFLGEYASIIHPYGTGLEYIHGLNFIKEQLFLNEHENENIELLNKFSKKYINES